MRLLFRARRDTHPGPDSTPQPHPADSLYNKCLFLPVPWPPQLLRGAVPLPWTQFPPVHVPGEAAGRRMHETSRSAGSSTADQRSPNDADAACAHPPPVNQPIVPVARLPVNPPMNGSSAIWDNYVRLCDCGHVVLGRQKGAVWGTVERLENPVIGKAIPRLPTFTRQTAKPGRRPSIC